MTQHANCCCAECEKLDRLPVRRHGIPHAKQSTFLAGFDPHPIDWPEVEPYAPSGPSQKPWESLPLFGSLSPDLFA